MKDEELNSKITLGQFIRALLEYYNKKEASWIKSIKINSNNRIEIELIDVQDKQEETIII